MSTTMSTTTAYAPGTRVQLVGSAIRLTVVSTRGDLVVVAWSEGEERTYHARYLCGG